jgi:hypothetical protein
MVAKVPTFLVPLLLGTTPAAAQPAPAQPVPAPVQTPPPFAPNAIRGTIQICEAARGEHRVRLEGGLRYAISATSPDFDPYLRLLPAGTEQVVAEDDDSGGGVTPRVSFTPPTSGDYVVRVTGAMPGAAGNYALSVTPQGPLPALVARPSRTQGAQWQIFEGALTEQSPTELGRRFTDYDLSLRPGEAAMIHVQGANLDTQLQIFPAAARGGRPLAEDDDGGGGTNPFIFFAPDQGGRFVVRVIGVDDRARGAYRLRIAR